MLQNLKRNVRVAALMVLWIYSAAAVMAKYKPAVWERPVAEGENATGMAATTLTVNRVVMMADETVVSIHVKFRPNYWVLFAKDTYLLAGGKRYTVTGAEGIELGEKHNMPESGEQDMTFRFPPLPEGTKLFDFIEGDGKGAFELLNIRPRPTKDTRIFPANWRSNETGEWLIGLLPEAAVYDGRLWEYKEKDINKGRFVITDGTRELAVKVAKYRKGCAQVSVGGSKAVECSRVDGKSLPVYPVPDNREGLKDNGYAMGDSVTIIGWLRGTSRNKWKRKRDMELSSHDIFADKYTEITIATDSLGRFRQTIPVCNAQDVFLRSGDAGLNMVLEPGETYFLLVDFNAGQTLIMGRDCRLQNEMQMGMFDTMERMPRLEGRNVPVSEVEAYLNRMTEYDRSFRTKADSVFAANPLLSERYKRYVLNENLSRQARDVGQARYRCDKFVMPKEMEDYAYRNYWMKMPVPYTAYSSSLSTFIRDFTSNASRDFNVRVTLDDVLERYDEYLNDEERRIITLFRDVNAEQEKMLRDNPGKEKEVQAEFANKYSDLVDKMNAMLRNDTFREIMQMKTSRAALEMTARMLDSLDTHPVLRDIVLAREAMNQIDNNRLPLYKDPMEYVTSRIELPLARKRLEDKNAAYLTLLNREITENSRPRTSLDAARVTDGETLLRKITEPFKGRAVLIDVWGTWCAPCKEGLSHSQEEYKALADADVVYLYLANRSEQKSVENIIREYNVEGPDVYHYNLPEEQQRAIESYLQVRSYPSYRLLDKEGNLQDVNADPRYNIKSLATLLKRIAPKNK